MLKKLFVLFVLVCCLASVKADISVIVSESSKLVLQDGDVRSLGDVQPGETIQVPTP